MNRREFVAAAATLPIAARGGTTLAGGPDLALVTCDTESRVAVVDLATGRVLRSIRTLPGPRSVERVGDVALVAHTALGAVSILDAHRVRRVLRSCSEPRYAAAHPLGRHAFVTDSAESDVFAVDVVRGIIVGRVRLDAWARHLTLDGAARTLWVGLGNAEERVAVVDVRDPARLRLVRYLEAPFGAHDVGFEAATVWVTAGDARELVVYDRRRGVRLRLPAGAPPQHVAFGRGVAYVTSGRDGVFRVHALSDGSVLRATLVPVGSYNVQHGDGGRVITPSLDHGTLAVLDPYGRLLRTIDVADSCHDACFIAP